MRAARFGVRSLVLSGFRTGVALPLELVRPTAGIRRDSCVAGVTGDLVLGVISPVNFVELAEFATGPLGTPVTNSTTTQRSSRSLKGLKGHIVHSFTGRNHGVGTSVTGSTSQTTVPRGVPIQFTSGVHPVDSLVACGAFGFVYPGDSGAGSNCATDFAHGAMTLGAVPIRPCVSEASTALGLLARVAIIARGVLVGVEGMNGVRQVSTGAACPLRSQRRTAVARSAQDRLHVRQIRPGMSGQDVVEGILSVAFVAGDFVGRGQSSHVGGEDVSSGISSHDLDALVRVPNT